MFSTKENTAAAPKRVTVPVEVACYSPEGYALRIGLELPIVELPEACAGWPRSATPPGNTAGLTPAPQRAAGRARTPPHYADDGAPCCPQHNRPLKEGRYGWYCSAKDDSTPKGYCTYTWKD